VASLVQRELVRVVVSGHAAKRDLGDSVRRDAREPPRAIARPRRAPPAARPRTTSTSRWTSMAKSPSLTQRRAKHRQAGSGPVDDLTMLRRGATRCERRPISRGQVAAFAEWALRRRRGEAWVVERCTVRRDAVRWRSRTARGDTIGWMPSALDSVDATHERRLTNMCGPSRRGLECASNACMIVEPSVLAASGGVNRARKGERSGRVPCVARIWMPPPSRILDASRNGRTNCFAD
jgi:hypothetical protein